MSQPQFEVQGRGERFPRMCKVQIQSSATPTSSPVLEGERVYHLCLENAIISLSAWQIAVALQYQWDAFHILLYSYTWSKNPQHGTANRINRGETENLLSVLAYCERHSRLTGKNSKWWRFFKTPFLIIPVTEMLAVLSIYKIFH